MCLGTRDVFVTQSVTWKGTPSLLYVCVQIYTSLLCNMLFCGALIKGSSCSFEFPNGKLGVGQPVFPMLARSTSPSLKMARSSHFDDLGLTVDQGIIPFPSQAWVCARAGLVAPILNRVTDRHRHPEQGAHSLGTARDEHSLKSLRSWVPPPEGFQGRVEYSIISPVER